MDYWFQKKKKCDFVSDSLRMRWISLSVIPWGWGGSSHMWFRNSFVRGSAAACLQVITRIMVMFVTWTLNWNQVTSICSRIKSPSYKALLVFSFSWDNLRCQWNRKWPEYRLSILFSKFLKILYFSVWLAQKENSLAFLFLIVFPVVTVGSEQQPLTVHDQMLFFAIKFVVLDPKHHLLNTACTNEVFIRSCHSYSILWIQAKVGLSKWYFPCEKVM